MSEQQPHKVPLSGADYFNLLVARNLEKLGYRGNVVHMALDLEGRISADEIRNRLQEKEIFSLLNSINLKRGYPFQMPNWEQSNERFELTVEEFEATEDVIPDPLLHVDLQPRAGKLFHIGLVQLPNGCTRLVFSAHHAIIDNRGLQMLVRMLDRLDAPENLAAFFPDQRVKDHFLKKVRQFNESRHFLMNADKRVASLLHEKIKPNQKTHYAIIDLSRDQTLLVDELAHKHGARFGNGPYYLAAAARSVNAILIDRGTHGNTHWVPVPQNQRMRGGEGAVLTNQISFMFYRIPHPSLNSLKEAVQVISQQMIDQVRSRMPESYATMMNIFRRMPLRIYNLFMKWPTKGVVTTFSFSDIGPSLEHFDTFMGRRIADVFHYPPNPVPPGFTIVFMRYRDCLRIVVGRTEQSMSDAELLKFENLLKLDLLRGDL